MMWFYLFAFVMACCFSVCFRVSVSHPIKVVRYAVKDIIEYIRYKEWRLCRTGKLVCFVGLFGKGKTLSAVHHVLSQYKRYNGKKIYDFGRKKWVTQYVQVISNVDLSIPHIKFTGLRQIVDIAEQIRKVDEENDTSTVTLVLGDEFSVQLNSRSFKDNIDPLFLNTLLTCRHHRISIYYTSQRFGHVDALLRQVTSHVISCNKCWRIMVHERYDAFELENATDTALVKPQKRFGWFIDDSDFSAYDTMACVGNLAKSCLKGDMLSEDEILALQSNNGANMEAVMKPSRKYVRSMKKRSK